MRIVNRAASLLRDRRVDPGESQRGGSWTARPHSFV